MQCDDQKSCMVWYQNSQGRIYFVKVCWAENWGKFRQRLTFPAFSLPQHYGERRWWPYFCQKGNWFFFCQLPSCFHTPQDTSNNEKVLEVSWLMVTDTLKYICSHVFLLNPQSVFYNIRVLLAFLPNLNEKMYSHSAPKRGVAGRK